MREPVSLGDLESQLVNLRSKANNIDSSEDLTELLPVYFVLASGYSMRLRNEINSRYEDEDAWEEFLAENDLTSKDFEKYESWWISPAGQSVVENLASKFMESIYEASPGSVLEILEDFFENHADWDDFIRELSQCTPADGLSQGGGPSYFAEYALTGGLCYSELEEPDFDQDLIVEVIEAWFRNCYDESQEILLTAFDEIMRIK